MAGGQAGVPPRLTVRRTSTRESGQIYLPAVNWLLFGGVLVLIVVFESSQRLASAYGLAVTGTLLLTTTLFLTYAAISWRWAWWKLALVAFVLGGLELTYLGANLVKVISGGWIPLLIAAAVVTVMTTWQRGRKVITARRADKEGSLKSVLFGFQDAQDLPAVLRQVHDLAPELDHDPGTASYFLSRMTITHGREPGMSSWRKRLFIGLSHNAANPAAYFHLPDNRTVVMGSRIDL